MEGYKKLCEECEFKRSSSTCAYKDNYFSSTCTNKFISDKSCGEFVLGCKYYECGLELVCERAYNRGYSDYREE